MSAPAAKTARSGTAAEGAAVAGATAAAGVIRADCDAHNHVAGGTPASNTDATTAVRLFMNQGREDGISSCLVACRTIEVLIGDTPRRRPRSSERSHNRLTVRGIPPDTVAIAFTAGPVNSSGTDATVSRLSMYSSTSFRFSGLKRHRRAIR